MVGTNEQNLHSNNYSKNTEQMKVPIQHHNSQVEVKQKCNKICPIADQVRDTKDRDSAV